MKQLFLITLLLLQLLLLAACADTKNTPEFEITGSVVRPITAKNSSRSYNLYIKLPKGYNEAENVGKKYPVIFFNDGGYCWLKAVGATRVPFNLGGYEQAILVGFSYVKGEQSINSRVRDYTPTDNPKWTKFETGGAKAYLDFMKNDAIPFIEKEYRTDSDRRMIVGHSLGGLFGAYALLKEPGLFADYILTSPSLWFHEEVIFDIEERAHKEGKPLSGRVFLATGETETPEINGGNHDMVRQQKAFANLLRSRNHKALIIKDVTYENGTHLTTYPIGLIEGLRWMLPGDNIYGG